MHANDDLFCESPQENVPTKKRVNLVPPKTRYPRYRECGTVKDTVDNVLRNAARIESIDKQSLRVDIAIRKCTNPELSEVLQSLQDMLRTERKDIMDSIFEEPKVYDRFGSV